MCVDSSHNTNTRAQLESAIQRSDEPMAKRSISVNGLFSNRCSSPSSRCRSVHSNLVYAKQFNSIVENELVVVAPHNAATSSLHPVEGFCAAIYKIESFFIRLSVCLCRRQTNAASAKPSRVLVFDTSTSHFSYSRLHSSLGSLEWFQHSPFKSVDHFIHFSNILFCVASQFKPEIEMF